MSSDVIEAVPLGSPPWPTVDPFLFCVHHLDHYPQGSEQMGVTPSALAGRNLGNDFVVKDGFRMYHGQVVPGFPQHPHRGFETVTIVRQGHIDHSDSLGAAARFGAGDVQWLTAGGGIVHSEMFPLLERSEPNPAELFQIWLNLPSKNKMAPPHFSMLWKDSIPKRTIVDATGRSTEIVVVAGQLGDAKAPPPPPHSWASDQNANVAIWCIKMQPGATIVLPSSGDAKTLRALYFFRGSRVSIGDHEACEHQLALVHSDRDVELRAGDSGGSTGSTGSPQASSPQVEIPGGSEPVELLMLQGRPIGEPVVQYGPFVMNSKQEIQKAFQDYQATQFGGWPWPSDDPVHGREQARFARHADGRIEQPG